MKVKIPLLLVVLIAAAAGYMLGTESGREQRDMLLEKMGRGGGGGDVADALTDA
jgi:hypothetical protein